VAELKEFVVKDAITIRDDILRTIKNGLVRQGIARPNVGPNTDWFVIATALGNELAVVGANAIVKADALMPDSATGDDLARWADVFERAKQLAAGSVGNVVLESSAATTIETGRQLTDAAGLRYGVVQGGDYDNGDAVLVRAISAGDATNHEQGDVLQWVSAPPFASDKVVVAAGGLVNGIDAEDDEVLRSRLLDIFRSPPGAGNAQHVAEIAEEASPSVQKAFVYPAIQGPGTEHVVVVAAPTATNKSRVLASTTLSGTVEPYVLGKLPTHAYRLVRSAEDVNCDVAFGLTLPEAATASPPGAGGGWLNGTPWPAPDGAATFRVRVTAASSDTSFTVDAQTFPTPGVSRVAWLNFQSWRLYTALVTAYSGTTGALVVTVDTPLVGLGTLQAGYLWPDCQNAQAYVDAVLDSFSRMGPGEKTTNASALLRGFRHPRPAAGWPCAVGPEMLRALTDAGDEVQAAQYFHRADDVTTKLGSAGVLKPQVPESLTASPRLFVPRYLGFYRVA
jgi:hypothetical protein